MVMELLDKEKKKRILLKSNDLIKFGLMLMINCIRGGFLSSRNGPKMQRRIALWTNRSEATKATRAERMRDAQKVRGPRGWVGFGMELETKGSSWTSGERLDTTGTHCYMCVLMQRVWWDSCIHVESSRSRRSRSVSQSVAVGESLTAVLRDRV